MTINLKTANSNASHYGKPLDIGIFDLISVAKPYFALENLREKDDFIYGDFEVELKEHDELLPISIAEVGRHIAIMGSLALAKGNPKKERHYYLATDAYIHRYHSRSIDDFRMTGRVKLEDINRKNGTISGTMYTSDGAELYDVRVSYMVLHHRMFERMFAANKVDVPDYNIYNPYRNSFTYENMQMGMDKCVGTVGKVEAKDCLGHFKNYPALPVARIGTAMSKIGGKHFLFANPSEIKRYCIVDAEFHATHLLFAGDVVKTSSEIINPNPGKGMIIKMKGFTDKIDTVAHSTMHIHY